LDRLNLLEEGRIRGLFSPWKAQGLLSWEVCRQEKTEQFHRGREEMFRPRAIRFAIFVLTLILFLVCFLTLTAEEARAIKLVDSKIDRWYRMEPDWGVLKSWPDKFQHLFFPFLLQDSNRKLLGSEKVFWALNFLGILKEFDDQEGVSFRDILCNTIGLWGAKYRNEKFTLLPTFEARRQNWKLMAFISF
jgi:hypothetical protein